MLHARLARSVQCRSGTSVLSAPSNSNGSDIRSNSSPTPKAGLRAAASSIASGSPSQRTQICSMSDVASSLSFLSQSNNARILGRASMAWKMTRDPCVADLEHHVEQLPTRRSLTHSLSRTLLVVDPSAEATRCLDIDLHQPAATNCDRLDLHGLHLVGEEPVNQAVPRLAAVLVVEVHLPAVGQVTYGGVVRQWLALDLALRYVDEDLDGSAFEVLRRQVLDVGDASGRRDRCSDLRSTYSKSDGEKPSSLISSSNGTLGAGFASRARMVSASRMSSMAGANCSNSSNGRTTPSGLR